MLIYYASEKSENSDTHTSAFSLFVAASSSFAFIKTKIFPVSGTILKIFSTITVKWKTPPLVGRILKTCIKSKIKKQQN